MRPATACHACRYDPDDYYMWRGLATVLLTRKSERKRKCRQEPSEAACQNCLALQVGCSLVYSQAKPTPEQSHGQSGTYAPNSENHITCHNGNDNDNDIINHDAWHREDTSVCLGGSATQTKELVGWYFRVIHDKHHSLFHQPSFEQDLENGSIPEVILYAILALGAR